MADLGQIWCCARCGYSATIPSTATAARSCPRCSGSRWWHGIQPRIDPQPAPIFAPPAPTYVVHIAGDPHEGLQACRQCAAVLTEESVIPAIAATIEYFPAGATITIGNDGHAMIGADPRGVPCRS